MKKLNLYIYSVVLFMLLAPAVSICIESILGSSQNSIGVFGKWFVFWGLGVRLFTAGLKQAITPSFTTEKILGIEDNESVFFVRELGLANISIGAAGVVSLFCPGWRIPVAFIGGTFLGIAGVLHIVKKPSGFNEIVATVSDLFIFAVMTTIIICSVFNAA